MAEVKVKITAQNEIQTGLQQALTDAKKFGQEATRSVTIDEQAAMEPIRRMQSKLADASKIPAPKLDDQQAVKVALEATGLEQIEQLKAAIAEADNKVLRVALEASGLSTAEELRDALAQAEDKTVELALEATGLSSVEELRAALDSADNKVVELALEATGLSGAEELREALAQTQDKTVSLALEATGLSSAEELRAALDSADNKTIQLALEATGLGSVQELREALAQTQDKTVSLALEATGLSSVEELRSALDQTENKSVQLALEATGLNTVEELRAALDQTSDKTVELALEATGLPDAKALQAAIEAAENKTVRLALEATGFSEVQQLQAAIDAVESKNIEIAADNERALAPLREIQAKLREIREEAGQPIEAPSTASAVGGFELTASESRRASTAIRGLASDLATAQSPAQALEAVFSRLAQAAGRLTTVVAAVAIGRILSAQFDKLNAGVESAINNARNFSKAFQGLGQPGDFSAVIGGFNQLNSIADRTGETIRGLKDDLGASFANFTLGGGPIRELEALEEAQRRVAGASLVEGSAFLAQQAEGRLAVAGDSNAEQEFERKARQQQELFQLNQALSSAQTSQDPGAAQLVLDLQNAIDFTNERFAIEDKIVAKRKEAAAAAKAAAITEKTAELKTANEERGMSPEELLARREEELRRNLDRQQQFAAFPEESEAAYGMTAEEAALEEEQITARILALRQQIADSAEAAAERTKQAAKSLADAIEDREFDALSPAEQQAKIAADSASLLSDLESGATNPAEAAQRALELQRREDALAAGGGGFAGAFGASSLQRIGGASEEFFRVRPEENKEQKRSNAILEKILTALQKGEPLVLKGST
jgi:hypothetical protein